MNVKGDRNKHLKFRWRNHDFFYNRFFSAKALFHLALLTRKMPSTNIVRNFVDSIILMYSYVIVDVSAPVSLMLACCHTSE